ncbi:conserved hypothetical protein [Culex quinquefasciatus]|uniref:Uncharacterized protein n=1 Tax=Culex quinquefasciatus TaxID=7176 RepID=B0X8U3_CULQU|nr:conserved hypothetical protein [Culex quinquefasciatus]|eukprot:XP_001866065.1 conserved hypothetical protein [Culex quinquefasciatus]
MQLNEMLSLSVGFTDPNEIPWKLQCSTGLLNICEMKHPTLTLDSVDRGMHLPATNLRLVDGWIPEFDVEMAEMLRPETRVLAIMNCYVRVFVIREMLRVLILDENVIEKVELVESAKQFELESLNLDSNRLTDISFVTKLTKLNVLSLRDNRLKHLDMSLFNNLRSLAYLSLISNQIKTLGTANMGLSPIEHLAIHRNHLTEFDTKGWRADNLTFLNIVGNRLRSINTVQFAKSFPSLKYVMYYENPWNCGQLESFQFYLQTRIISNFSYDNSLAQCYEDNVHRVALRLPELIDLSEDSLINLKTTVGALLFLTTRFAVRQDVVWDIRCNTGSPNICELNDVTLTADIADLRTFFPATNLRMIDGWIPVFDVTMAGMLRKETKVLVIMRCYVQYFVVREMLKVLILTSNAIRNLFGIANNQIADLNIKNWRAPNMTSFSVQVNKLQSINTVQLLEAFPRMSSFQYDENPWNCERLKSLQFYIKMRPHKVYNFTRRFATCHDRDMVNNVALKLPELIDLSERKLGDLGGRIRQLIEGNGEGKQLASLQFRVAKTQQILEKMSTGLGKLTLSVGFINPNEVLWELQCSTGWLNICELKYATLTDDVTGQGLLLPATNLRMTDGWIPEFDTKMAQLLRPETHTLVILNCYVRLFVIREMLRVLILDGNRVEKIDIFESGSPFEIQILSAENNQLTDLSFVSRLGKLESLGVNGNKLEVLKMHWFKNLRNLNILNLSSNKIKTIESAQMQSLPIEHLLLEHNLLTEFNTKHWQAHNLSY